MSLDEKNNKDTENNRVSYSEYQDLTPIDHIENGEEYIDKITLEIMIDCKYFEFATSNYSAVKDVSPNLSLQFVLNNQDEYMELKTSISMTTGLFEGLICSRSLKSEHRARLFSEYGKNYMTEKVALHMNELQLPITKDIFNVAWSHV